MNRLKQTFQQGPAYVGYLTAGDGGFDHSLNAFKALIEGGVNIIEVGVPFSDPVADGVIIQQASQRALQQGFSLQKVLHLIKALRESTDVPIILFSYYNPIYRYAGNFYHDAKSAGVDGILVVDLPLEEAHAHLEQCQNYHVDPIFLISPSTTPERLKKINNYASGMLYYVCRNGITGLQSMLPDGFKEKMREIKQHTALPVVTGFGISNRSMAELALQQADGFVIGSLFVETAHHAKNLSELTQLAKALKPRSQPSS